MNYLRQSRGFTLIEVLIASITLALSVTAVVAAFNNVERLNRQSKNVTIATQVVQQQMEIYRNTSYSNIPIGTNDISSLLTPYPSLGSPRSATATVAEIDAAGLKQVDIALSYTDSGKTKKVQVTTLITDQGINR